MGDFDEAEAHFAAAQKAQDGIDGPAWTARTRLGWARRLLTQGRQQAGIDVVTAAKVHFGSVEDVLVRLGLAVDKIYVDLDVDVLDSAFAPVCAGARPGGPSAGELLAAAFLAGRDRRVRAVDIV